MEIDKGAELDGAEIAKDVLKLIQSLAKREEALSSAFSSLQVEDGKDALKLIQLEAQKKEVHGLLVKMYRAFPFILGRWE